VGLPETVPYLDWRWDDLIFLLMAGVMLGSALLVVVGRDIIRSALWLIVSFAGLAAIYGLLGNGFMAITQVLVYIGAIAVLVLFAVMITQSKRGPAQLVFQRQWWGGLIAAVALFLLLAVSIGQTEFPLAADVLTAVGARDIALNVFGEYGFAFLVLGVLLLAAVIGALYLARRDDDMPETNRQPRLTADDEEVA
jgi:NADH-quinone oxidoreductase subunit J